MTMKTSRYISGAALAWLLGAGLACGQTATYSFDSAQWSAGASTPFLNMAPDTGGLPALRATFRSSPTAGAYVIGAALVNPSFSGQCLYQPGPYTGNTLTITLSLPVNSLHLDFAQHGPGHFDFTSATGTASTLTATQSGSLDFQSATAFTQFSLAAVAGDNSLMPFAIDNLSMTVPEPSSVALVGLGAAALGLVRRRK
jgi:hypothetical protein